MKPLALLIVLLASGCAPSPREQFIDSLDAFNDQIERAHADCQRGDCRRLDAISQSIEQAGGSPFNRQPIPSITIYSTSGDGVWSDSNGNIYDVQLPR